MDLLLKTVGKIHSTKVSCVRAENFIFLCSQREKSYFQVHHIGVLQSFHHEYQPVLNGLNLYKDRSFILYIRTGIVRLTENGLSVFSSNIRAVDL